VNEIHQKLVSESLDQSRPDISPLSGLLLIQGNLALHLIEGNCHNVSSFFQSLLSSPLFSNEGDDDEDEMNEERVEGKVLKERRLFILHNSSLSPSLFIYFYG